jgi:hypothetical protein
LPPSSPSARGFRPARQPSQSPNANHLPFPRKLFSQIRRWELGWQRRGYPLAVEGRHPGSTTPAGFWCVVVVGGQIEGPHRRRAWIYTPSTRRSASSLLAPVLDWRRRHLDPPPRCGISSTDSRPPATRWPRTGGGLRCSATTSGTWTRTTWRWTPGSTASASASLPSPTSRWRSSARAPWVLPHP